MNIGPENVEINSFAFSASGKTLYYSSCADGVEPDKINDDGTHVPGKKIKQYSIRGARFIGDSTGRFSKTFPFADMKDTPIDQLQGVESGNRMLFLFSNITNMADSAADVWLASVPYIAAITIEGCSSTNPFVGAGNKEPFTLRFRNDGNVAVTNFTVSFYEQGSSTAFASAIPVTCDFENILPTEFDIPDDFEERIAAGEEGFADFPYEFGEAAQAGVSLPGETKSVIVENVPIPAGWSGDKNIEVKLDPGSIVISTVVSPEGISFDEVDEVSEVALQFETPGVATTIEFIPPSSDTLEVAPNNYLFEDDPKPGPKPGPKPLVPTGDNLNGAAVAATAVAGLGVAALSAYNERRHRYGKASTSTGEAGDDPIDVDPLD